MGAFLISQIKKIEFEKWIEGVHTSSDPGDEFIFCWIAREAKNFRNSWNKSLCKYCCFSDGCGHLVKQECSSYLECDGD